MQSLPFPCKIVLFFMFLFGQSAYFCLVHALEEKAHEEKKKGEQTPVITKEILVVGESPKERPVSSAWRILPHPGQTS